MTEGLAICVRCRTAFVGTCSHCKPNRIWRFMAVRVCHKNACGHAVSNGCSLHPLKPCRTDPHFLLGGGCLADPPMFGPMEAPNNER